MSTPRNPPGSKAGDDVEDDDGADGERAQAVDVGRR